MLLRSVLWAMLSLTASPVMSASSITINQELDFGLIGPETGETTDVGSTYSVLPGGGTSTTGGGIFFGGEQRAQFTVNVPQLSDLPMRVIFRFRTGAAHFNGAFGRGDPRMTIASVTDLICTFKAHTLNTTDRWCCIDDPGSSGTNWSVTFWGGALNAPLDQPWTAGPELVPSTTEARVQSRDAVNNCP